MKKTFVALCVTVLTIPACSSEMTPGQKAFLHELADRPVTCDGKTDCEAKWNLAIKWVSKHSQTGFRNITADLIVTNSVSDGARPPFKYPEFTVVRYARDSTKVLDFDSYCEHGFACNPSALKLRADFVTYVMGPPRGVTVNKDGTGATKIIHPEEQ